MSNSTSGSSNESPPSPGGNESPPGGNESSPPDFSTFLDGKKQADSPQEGNNNSPPSESSPPSPSSDSSPPSEGGDNSSPPDSSNSSPPPESDNGSSSSSPPSPPFESESSPPPSESENKSPPPESTDSSSSPPPPSEEGDKESPPPPEEQKSKPSPPPPPPQEGSLPPPQSQSSPPPPQESASPPSGSGSGSGSPPTSKSSPSPPPPKSSEAYPPPNGDSALSPPSERGSPPLQGSPPDAISPPQSRDSPRTPSRDNSSPSNDDTPSSPSSHESPKHNPSSKESNSQQSSYESNSSDGPSSTHVVGAVVGVVVIFLIAIFFVVARRKKSRKQAHYIPPPDSFTVRTDGYYCGPQHPIGIPGNSQEYYSGPPPMGFAPGNTYESIRGNAFNTNGPESGMLGGSKSCFSYEELMEITHGFSRENILGEGGFGCVYKGWLSDGRVVAVKQLKVGSGQGEREFRAEVDIISRVHHRHLVSLVGYCIADNQRLLVYEFVPNKTLEYHLHGEGLPVMEWPKRLSIAIGSARGLAYLHEDCHPKIIHRDIKSANILVDDSFEAQVADFGLAKLSTDTYTHVSTRVMGTFGYMAPEYASSGKLTDRSDVFSFGVVLLEIVTGRKPVDQSRPMGDESLVEWARPLLIRALQTGDISELVDPRLENKYVESEMLRVIEAAAACIRHSAPKRPRMVQVLRSLDSEGDMPDLSNGVKYGQSTVFESRQYSSDIQKFRNLAFGDDSSEYDAYSGEFGSREKPRRPPNPGMSGDMSSAEYTSGESETRAMNPRRW